MWGSFAGPGDALLIESFDGSQAYRAASADACSVAQPASRQHHPYTPHHGLSGVGGPKKSLRATSSHCCQPNAYSLHMLATGHDPTPAAETQATIRWSNRVRAIRLFVIQLSGNCQSLFKKSCAESGIVGVTKDSSRM